MIFWLASYPKSGNTWLRIFLSAYQADRPADINNTGAFSYDDMAPYTWQVISPKPLPEMSVEEIAACRGAYLVHLNARADRKRLFVKTHTMFGEVAGFPTIPAFLSEGAICLVRDPRDVACSYAHHCQNDIGQAVEFLCRPGAMINIGPRFHGLGTWSEHVGSWCGDMELPRLVVRYEDMVAAPHKTFGQIVRHLGWDVDADRLDRAISSTAFDRLQAQEGKTKFREQAHSGAKFFRQGRVGTWRDQLTPEHATRIAEAHGDMMERLGYACDSDAGRTPRADGDADPDQQDQRDHPLQECG